MAESIRGRRFIELCHFKNQFGGRPRTKGERRVVLLAERLEQRTLFSAESPLAGLTATPHLEVSAAGLLSSIPSALTPAQVRHAYGLDQIYFSGGTVAGDGTGQTIAIVDAYDDPNISADLKAFDRTFGIADPPQFNIVKQTIGGRAPAADAGWAGEIALDVEWAHAIAPKANILLVEANSGSLNNLLASIDYARRQTGVSVVSMSWGASEFSTEASYDSYFTTPANHANVAFVASSGDWGAPAIWPAVSSKVLAVGGTSLHLSGGAYSVETAWSGSGGGVSQYLAEPGYQTGVQSTGRRTNPDVAYDADPRTGFAVYDSYGSGGWAQIGGTSAGSPQWAAITAIADQGRALSGKPTLANLGPAVYSLPGADFHDVTSGSNGYAAHVGYDLVTGRGTPIANLVVGDLAGVAVTAAPSSTAFASSTATAGRLFGSRQAVANADAAGAAAASQTAEPASNAAANITTVVQAPAANPAVFTSFATLPLNRIVNQVAASPVLISPSRLAVVSSAPAAIAKAPTNFEFDSQFFGQARVSVQPVAQASTAASGLTAERPGFDRAELNIKLTLPRAAGVILPQAADAYFDSETETLPEDTDVAPSDSDASSLELGQFALALAASIGLVWRKESLDRSPLGAAI